MKKRFKMVFLFIVAFAISISVTNLCINSKPKEIVIEGMIPQLTEQELILNSDLIVTGTVSATGESKWSNPDFKVEEKRNILQTDIFVEIDEILYGEYNKENVVVRIDKGYDKAQKIRYISDGYPDFEKDEKVLLFLSRDDSDVATDEDYFVLTGMRQGKWNINNEEILKKNTDGKEISSLDELKTEQLKERIITDIKEHPTWKADKLREKEEIKNNNKLLFGE